MTQTSPVIPKAAVRGTASGVLFMSFFDALWACLGFVFDSLDGWVKPVSGWQAATAGLRQRATDECAEQPGRALRRWSIRRQITFRTRKLIGTRGYQQRRVQ